MRTYNSAKEASRCLHLHPRTIDKACRGDVFTIKGLQWRRFLVDEVPQTIEKLQLMEIRNENKPIALLDENDNIVEVYPSIKKASETNGIDTHSLSNQLNGKYKYVGKTKFRYLNEAEITKYNLNKFTISRGKIAIRQYKQNGQLVATYKSINDAAKRVGLYRYAIQQCLSGKNKTAGGYFWIKDDIEAEQKLTLLLSKKNHFYQLIIQLDMNGKIIAKYKSSTEAYQASGVNPKTISQAIRKNIMAGGYYWKGKK